MLVDDGVDPVKGFLRRFRCFFLYFGEGRRGRVAAAVFMTVKFQKFWEFLRQKGVRNRVSLSSRALPEGVMAIYPRWGESIIWAFSKYVLAQPTRPEKTLILELLGSVSAGLAPLDVRLRQ